MSKQPFPRFTHAEWTAVQRVLAEAATERERQQAKWGQQNHDDGTGAPTYRHNARKNREFCESAFKHGTGTWLHILAEEVSEAFAESDPARLREELLQVAAVAVAWVEAIDRRAKVAPLLVSPSDTKATVPQGERE